MDKKALNKAFAMMRSEGFLALQNFTCCQTCGGYEGTEKAVELVKAHKAFKGLVYYHAQDANDLNRGRDFYLAYGSVNSTELGILGLDDLSVGRRVKEILEFNGIKVEWDENPNQRMLIKNSCIKKETK